MKMLVGLGNPGKKYERDRHNFGFMLINYIADQYGIDLNEKKFKAIYGKGNIDGHSVLLVQPQTYMNLSGESVSPLSGYFKIPHEDILVISDDLALEMGRIRLRKKGSDGGHNGLKSIIQQLGTQNFSRLRLGIGMPQDSNQIKNYVLSKFTSEDDQIILDVLKRSEQAIQVYLSESIDKAMNQFNS